ncbi:MAG TPA: PEP-CTERM sorting domain-containing protein [Candidatus Sulfotelmatobacter sp.]|nr:PEP-CTERM sorting domain-containing protein [Candidatus Sulfotelmatobacter sp.]
MLSKKTAGYTVGDWLARLPRWIVVRTCLALLLFGSIAHATPISGLEDKNPANSSALATAVTTQDSQTTAANPASGDTALMSHRDLSVDVSSDPASDNCGFSSNCYTKMKVPEPQSLVLVGSGLLSMAGLIRRRLIR